MSLIVRFKLTNYFRGFTLLLQPNPTSRVGKLRPAGQLRPAKGKSVAREHVFILNEMWPAKENSAARDHVNVARRTKLF